MRVFGIARGEATEAISTVATSSVLPPHWRAIIVGMAWRGERWLVVAVVGVASVACAPLPSDDATLDSVPRTPAAPSFAQDAGGGGDAPTNHDATPADDAGAPDASDAAVEACATGAYCDGKLLVTPTAGQLFCSEKTAFCQFGCVEVDGGVACAAFDPASCPQGVPWESATTCPYMFKSLCFNTITAACECASCGDAWCKGSKLKLPKPPDGGLPPSLPNHVSCDL